MPDSALSPSMSPPRDPRPARAPRSLPRAAGLAPFVVPALAVALALAAQPAAAATPRVHAIVGARIVTAPGQVIERGTIVMRDGLVIAVGADVAVPADARIWEGDSLTVYPGLIDAFVLPAEAPAGAPGGPVAGAPGRGPGGPAAAAVRGARSPLASVTPEARVAETLPLGQEQLESLRAAGFAAARVAPRRGIFRGTSAVVGLGDAAPNASVLRADAAQVLALEPQRMTYPNSLMGAIAVIRQTLLDARWYREARAAYAKSPQAGERPETNLSWEALQPVIAGEQTALFVAGGMLEVLRSAALAHEAGLRAQVVGAGDEYKRAGEVAKAGVPLVVPVNFPDPPDVSDPDNALEVAIEELRRWNDAPGNAAILARNGVTFALTACGLKDAKQFRANVAKAIGRGLTAEQALAAVTTVPAQMLGLSDRLGVIAAGRIANLTVTRGDLFSSRGKVREVWVDGNRYEVPDPEDRGMRGSWSLSWEGGRGTLSVAAEKDTVVRLVAGVDTLAATAVRLEGSRLKFAIERPGAERQAFDLATKNDCLSGTLSLAAGPRAVRGGRLAEPAPAPRPAEAPVATPVVMGNSEPWRMPIPEQPAAVLVRNATLWTAGPRDILQQTDLLVRAGKIAAVGRNLAAPAGAIVIDGTGKHVAPGIIDCHSHTAILGAVNECTNSVTSEVRIEDVINSENVNIYRELAGGVTAIHALHGSCNAIGGQNAVLKLRWGQPPEALRFAGAPPTIKFALGENVKQSNFDPEMVPGPPRYPQSRSGVEEVIRDAFIRARDYRATWQEWSKKKQGLPPRRDLQLEPLVEVLEGRRMIHPHSYRQDEILMLMRVAEEFGFKVGTFQHVLEGYKVADEMARHGAGASAASDWWGYKYEAIDAIPWNGYLMWDRGVVVSYGSDSDELARRLSLEAAKAIKYGGVPPEEAIKFVTLNPAKQLEIDSRVGSLEVGKDADFSIWSTGPMSPYAVCEQTWVDGRKYFDRAADLAGREALAKERDLLIARAKAARKEGPPSTAGPRRGPPRYLEETDMTGSRCGLGEHAAAALRSGSGQHELQSGEVQR